ncbi:hypothetical protein CYMTET_55247 [Cymbomonas tetramitiformis]|uniref:Uncharacterized protein n=1 Tax=Cymbomonas tetramitiformis TaxID=36881 RepID=A0AAE0EPX6_9CHLO|nr:hypothetical protein CYMTET_55247 [Cymbomonas tetramitiformis]
MVEQSHLGGSYHCVVTLKGDAHLTTGSSPPREDAARDFSEATNPYSGGANSPTKPGGRGLGFTTNIGQSVKDTTQSFIQGAHQKELNAQRLKEARQKGEQELRALEQEIQRAFSGNKDSATRERSKGSHHSKASKSKRVPLSPQDSNSLDSVSQRSLHGGVGKPGPRLPSPPTPPPESNPLGAPTAEFSTGKWNRINTWARSDSAVAAIGDPAPEDLRPALDTSTASNEIVTPLPTAKGARHPGASGSDLVDTSMPSTIPTMPTLHEAGTRRPQGAASGHHGGSFVTRPLAAAGRPYGGGQEPTPYPVKALPLATSSEEGVTTSDEGLMEAAIDTRKAVVMDNVGTEMLRQRVQEAEERALLAAAEGASARAQAAQHVVHLQAIADAATAQQQAEAELAKGAVAAAVAKSSSTSALAENAAADLEAKLRRAEDSQMMLNARLKEENASRVAAQEIQQREMMNLREQLLLAQESAAAAKVHGTAENASLERAAAARDVAEREALAAKQHATAQEAIAKAARAEATEAMEAEKLSKERMELASTEVQSLHRELEAVKGKLVSRDDHQQKIMELEADLKKVVVERDEASHAPPLPPPPLVSAFIEHILEHALDVDARWPGRRFGELGEKGIGCGAGFHSEARARVDASESRVQAYEASASAAEELLAKERKGRAEALARSAEVEARMDTKVEQISDATRQTAELQADLARVKTQVGNLEEDRQALQRELDNTRQQRLEEARELDVQTNRHLLAVRANPLLDEGQRNEKLQERLEKAVRELQEAEETAREWKSRGMAAEAKIERLTAEESTAIGDKRHAEEESGAKSERIKELRAAVAAALKEKNEAKQELASQVRLKEQAEHKRHLAEHQVSTNEHALGAQREDAARAQHQSEKQLKELREEFTSISAASQRKIRNLEDQVAEAQAEVTRSVKEKEKAVSATRTNAESSASLLLGALETEADNLRASVHHKDLEIGRQQIALRQLESQIAEMSGELGDTRSTLTNRQGANQRAANRCLHLLRILNQMLKITAKAVPQSPNSSPIESKTRSVHGFNEDSPAEDVSAECQEVAEKVLSSIQAMAWERNMHSDEVAKHKEEAQQAAMRLADLQQSSEAVASKLTDEIASARRAETCSAEEVARLQEALERDRDLLDQEKNKVREQVAQLMSGATQARDVAAHGIMEANSARDAAEKKAQASEEVMVVMRTRIGEAKARELEMHDAQKKAQSALDECHLQMTGQAQEIARLNDALMMKDDELHGISRQMWTHKEREVSARTHIEVFEERTGKQAAELDTLRQKNKELARQVSAARVKRKSTEQMMTDDLESAQQRVKYLQQSLESSTEERKSLEKQLKQQTLKAGRSQKDMELAFDVRSELETALRSTKAELDELTDAHNLLEHRLRDTQNMHTLAKQDLEGNLAKQLSLLQSADSELQAKQSEIHKLTSQAKEGLDAAGGLQVSLQLAMAQRDEAQKALEETSGKLEDAQSRLWSLQEATSSKSSALVVVEETLSRDSAAWHKERETLKSMQRASMKAAEIEATAKNERIRELRNAMSETLDAKVKAMEQWKAEKEEMQQQQTTEKADMEESLKLESQAVASAQSELAMIAAVRDALENEVEHLSTTLQTSEAKGTKMEEELRMLHSALQASHTELHQTKMRYAEVLQQADVKDTEMGQALQEKNMLEEVSLAAEGRMEEVQHQVRSLEDQLEMHKAGAEEQRRQRLEQQSRAEETEAELDEVRAKLKSTETEVERVYGEHKLIVEAHSTERSMLHEQMASEREQLASELAQREQASSEQAETNHTREMMAMARITELRENLQQLTDDGASLTTQNVELREKLEQAEARLGRRDAELEQVREVGSSTSTRLMEVQSRSEQLSEAVTCAEQACTALQERVDQLELELKEKADAVHELMRDNMETVRRLEEERRVATYTLAEEHAAAAQHMAAAHNDEMERVLSQKETAFREELDRSMDAAECALREETQRASQTLQGEREVAEGRWREASAAAEAAWKQERDSAAALEVKMQQKDELLEVQVKERQREQEMQERMLTQLREENQKGLDSTQRSLQEMLLAKEKMAQEALVEQGRQIREIAESSNAERAALLEQVDLDKQALRQALLEELEEKEEQASRRAEAHERVLLREKEELSEELHAQIARQASALDELADEKEQLLADHASSIETALSEKTLMHQEMSERMQKLEAALQDKEQVVANMSETQCATIGREGTLIEQHQVVKERLAEAEERLTRLALELGQSQEGRADLEERVRHLQNSLGESFRDKLAAEQTLANGNRDLEAMEAEHKFELNQMQLQVDQLAASATSAKEVAERERDLAVQELSGAKETLQAMIEQKDGQLKEARQHLEDLRLQHDSQQGSHAESLLAAEAMVHRLQSELSAERHAAATKVETLEAEVERCEQSCTQANGRMDRLQTQTSAALKTVTKSMTQQADITTSILSNELAEATRTRLELMNEVGRLNAALGVAGEILATQGTPLPPSLRPRKSVTFAVEAAGASPLPGNLFPATPSDGNEDGSSDGSNSDSETGAAGGLEAAMRAPAMTPVMRREAEALQLTIASHRAELEAAKQQAAEASQDKSRMESEAAAARMEAAEAKREAAEAQTQLMGMHGAVEMERERRGAKAAAASAAAVATRKSGTAQQLETREAEAGQLRQQVESMEAAMALLRREMEAAAESAEANKISPSAMLEQAQALMRAESTAAAAATRADQAELEVKHLRAAVASKESEVEELRGRLAATAEAAAAAAHAQLDRAARDAMGGLAASNASEVEEATAKLGAERHEDSRTREIVGVVRDEVEALERLQAVEAVISTWRNTCKEKEETIRELEAEMQRYEAEMQLAVRQRELAEGSIEVLNKELEAVRESATTVASMSREVAAVAEREKELLKAQHAAASAQAASYVAELQSHVAKQQEDLLVANALADAGSENTTHVAMLEEEVARLQNESEVSQARGEEAFTMLKAVQQELLREREALQEARREASEAGAAASELRSQLALVQDRSFDGSRSDPELHAQLAAARAEAAAAQQRERNAAEALERAQAELVAVVTVQSEAVMLRQQVVNLEAEVAKAWKEVAEAENRMEEMEARAEADNPALAELRREVEHQQELATEAAVRARQAEESLQQQQRLRDRERDEGKEAEEEEALQQHQKDSLVAQARVEAAREMLDEISAGSDSAAVAEEGRRAAEARAASLDTRAAELEAQALELAEQAQQQEARAQVAEEALGKLQQMVMDKEPQGSMDRQVVQLQRSLERERKTGAAAAARVKTAEAALAAAEKQVQELQASVERLEAAAPAGGATEEGPIGGSPAGTPARLARALSSEFGGRSPVKGSPMLPEVALLAARAETKEARAEAEALRAELADARLGAARAEAAEQALATMQRAIANPVEADSGAQTAQLQAQLELSELKSQHGELQRELTNVLREHEDAMRVRGGEGESMQRELAQAKEQLLELAGILASGPRSPGRTGWHSNSGSPADDGQRRSPARGQVDAEDGWNLRAEATSVVAELGRSREQVEQLEASNRGLAEKALELKGELLEKKEALLGQCGLQERLESKQSELEALGRQLRATEEAMQTLRGQRAEGSGGAAAAADAATALHKADLQAADASMEAARLQSALASRDGALSELRAQLAAHGTSAAEASAEASSQLAEASQACQEARHQQQLAQEQAAHLEGVLRTKEQMVEDLREKLSAAVTSAQAAAEVARASERSAAEPATVRASGLEDDWEAEGRRQAVEGVIGMWRDTCARKDEELGHLEETVRITMERAKLAEYDLEHIRSRLDQVQGEVESATTGATQREQATFSLLDETTNALTSARQAAADSLAEASSYKADLLAAEKKLTNAATLLMRVVPWDGESGEDVTLMELTRQVVKLMESRKQVSETHVARARQESESLRREIQVMQEEMRTRNQERGNFTEQLATLQAAKVAAEQTHHSEIIALKKERQGTFTLMEKELEELKEQLSRKTQEARELSHMLKVPSNLLAFLGLDWMLRSALP